MAGEVMDEPHCSPNLAPSGVHLFGPLKKHVAGKLFAADIDVKQTVMPWLQTLDTHFFYTGIQALVPWWDKCLNINCDWWKSDVYHLLSMCHVYIEVGRKFSASCNLCNMAWHVKGVYFWFSSIFYRYTFEILGFCVPMLEFLTGKLCIHLNT
jgi:hypothetical protein